MSLQFHADPWATGWCRVYSGTCNQFQWQYRGSWSVCNCILSGVGTITSIAIGNSGFGYAPGVTATVTIGPGGTNVPFRAIGVATIRFNSVKTTGTIGIGSTVITGMQQILLLEMSSLESGFDASYNFIPSGTFVTPDSIILSNAATNVGIATSSFEFGIDRCGVVTGILYLVADLYPPLVTIQNDITVSNYHEEVAGVHCKRNRYIKLRQAKLTAYKLLMLEQSMLSEQEQQSSVSIASPPQMDSTGNFEFNEIVTGLFLVQQAE